MDLKTYRTKADAINADLAALFEKHGFKMGPLTASVDEAGGTIRYTIRTEDVNLKDANGNAVDADRLYYVNSGKYYGLKPEWLDKEFVSGGRTFVVLGLKNTKAKNKVVVARKGDQTRRIAPVNMITEAFELAELRAKIA